LLILFSQSDQVASTEKIQSVADPTTLKNEGKNDPNGTLKATETTPTETKKDTTKATNENGARKDAKGTTETKKNTGGNGEC